MAIQYRCRCSCGFETKLTFGPVMIGSITQVPMQCTKCNHIFDGKKFKSEFEVPDGHDYQESDKSCPKCKNKKPINIAPPGHRTPRKMKVIRSPSCPTCGDAMEFDTWAFVD